MTQRIAQQLLNNISAAGDSLIYNLDYRFDQNPVHTIAGTLTAGDSIVLLLSPNTGTQTPDVWVTAAVYTSTTFMDIFWGSSPRIKVNKVGTTGVSTVYVV